MPFVPKQPVRGHSWRSFVFRFSFFASTCVVLLFLGTMYCFNSCNLVACDDQQCAMRSQKVNCDTAAQQFGERETGGWIGSFFSRTVSKPKLSAFMVVLILSSASNMEQRVTIRQTWLKELRSDILHLFAIGASVLDDDEKRTLESEIARFQDILFLPDVNDTYDNLTKKLLNSLVWIDNSVQYQYLLKADDDTFARVDDIVIELQSLAIKERLYWGFFDGRASVHRKGKWVEKNWVLCDHYLPYALGGGYVLSADMTHFIASNKDYLKLYTSEDVSLGAWLAPVDVRRVHDPRFDTEYHSRGCFNSYLVTHKQSIDQMREKYWLLQEKGELCASEQRTRLSYNYNWRVPPSQCCIRNDSKIP